jgi:hypothetical protein
MDIFNADKLLLFFMFFVPGFISTKIWSLIMPSDYRKISDYLLEVLSYGCINFAIWFYPAYLITKNNNFCWWVYLFWLIVLFISPILWPIIIRTILMLNLLKGKIMHPIAKPWDYFFGTGEACYILIHLKSGKLIAGLYGSNSFASSFPSAEELYLEEVWKINEEGEFQDKIDGTSGIWISKESFDYIEIFKPITEEK